jgi:hypothetical protein
LVVEEEGNRMKALRFCVDQVYEGIMVLEVCKSTDKLPSREELEACEKEGDWWEVIDCINVNERRFFEFTKIVPRQFEGKPIVEGITVLQFHDEIDLDGKSLGYI